jgi:hypothetical protein
VEERELCRLASQLAAADLDRMSRRRRDTFWRVLGAAGGGGGSRAVGGVTPIGLGSQWGREIAQDQRRQRRACLEFAVEDVVRVMSEPDRERLAHDHELPADFLQRVSDASKEVATRMRGHW